MQRKNGAPINRRRLTAVKKIISLLMVCFIVLSFAACGKGEKGEKHSEELKIPDKKVALLVAPESQYPEDYMAAKELQSQYPDNIIVREYSDSRVLVPGDPDIVNIAKELAQNEAVGALVFARATQFTYLAIKKAKELNPELVTVAVEPDQGMDLVAEISDLVLVADWKLYAADIVSCAAKMGAEYFVMFSYERHAAGNPLYAQLKKTLADECYAKEIEFVYDAIQDPNYAGGPDKSRFSVKQGLVGLYNNKRIKGKNVALFSTDSSVQSTLVEECRDRDLIYLMPSYPTAYNGLCEVFDAQVPEDYRDIDTFVSSLTASIAEDEHGGKFAVYTAPFASVMVRGAVYSAFDILSDSPDSVTAALKAAGRVKDAGGKKLAAEPYPSYEKTVKCYLPGLELIKIKDKK